MGLEKNHTNYTAEDIQKYFSEKLTPAEMHAMEKAALEDSFLAEAMEGYQGMKEKDWEQPLKLLNTHFNATQNAKIISRKPATTYRMWKAAAAILLLCSGVAISYMLTKKDPAKDNSIATYPTKQDSANFAITEQAIVDTLENKTSLLDENTTTAKQPIVAKSAQKPLQQITSEIRPGNVVKMEGNSTTGKKYERDQLKGRPDLASANPAQSAEQKNLQEFDTNVGKVNNQLSKDATYYKLSEKTIDRTFAAQVVGADGSPLPFANIRISKELPGTYADARGNFSIKSADSIINIDIKSVGHVSGNFTLRSDLPGAKLELTDDEPALKEIEVTGYGTKRKSASIPNTVSNVAPVDGWNNYQLYLVNNLFVSDNILQKNIHGDVLISFKVQNDGTITNLKIEKSLCEECDIEALRLIKEGPNWKVLNSRNVTGQVIIKF